MIRARAGSAAADTEALAIGYDFGEEVLFVDQRNIGNDSEVVQTAPFPRAQLASQRHGNLRVGGPGRHGAISSPLRLRVLVDGAMVETFLGSDVALTSFVDPKGAVHSVR